MDEQWKVVAEAPNYEVSTQGRVRNRVTGHMKSLQIDLEGRPSVNLWCEGRQMMRRVSRLMALAHLPPPLAGQTDVCHDDGDNQNNVIENLRWDTHRANMLDRRAHGTARNGNSLKTHCKWGHEFTPENTAPNGRGRKCRTCQRRLHRERRRRKREQR